MRWSSAVAPCAPRSRCPILGPNSNKHVSRCLLYFQLVSTASCSPDAMKKSRIFPILDAHDLVTFPFENNGKIITELRCQRRCPRPSPALGSSGWTAIAICKLIGSCAKNIQKISCGLLIWLSILNHDPACFSLLTWNLPLWQSSKLLLAFLPRSSFRSQKGIKRRSVPRLSDLKNCYIHYVSQPKK